MIDLLTCFIEVAFIYQYITYFTFDAFDICILVQFYQKHFMITFLTLARKLNFLTSNEVSTAYISNR
jgi:hypothetical protein